MGRTTFRAGAIAAMAGALLALAGNLLHPRGGDDPDFRVYRDFAHSTRLRFADLMLIAAAVLLLAGFVAIAAAVRQGADDSLSRYGGLFAAVGGTIAIAAFGVESFAYRLQAQGFKSARGPDLHAAFWAANAVDHLNEALFLVWTLVFIGIAPLLIGIANLRNPVWPSWIGWLGTLGGGTCTVVATVLFVKTDSGALDIPFLVGSLLVTAWALCSGVWLFRSAALLEGRGGSTAPNAVAS